MVTVFVNKKPVKAQKNETILSLLNHLHIHVPTLCSMEGLAPDGACRICIVEETNTNKLIPSCSTRVSHNMSILTHSERVIKTRKTIIELLLDGHPDDCLYCVRQGNCQLSTLAREYGVRRENPGKTIVKKSIDISSPSFVRDNNKCILCGKCVRMCHEIQGIGAIDFIHRGSKTVIGPAFSEDTNRSSCINCGQCIMVCPTGALSETDNTAEVMDALSDKKKIVAVQVAPSISVTIAEEFGCKPGLDVSEALVAALRKIGFHRVFNTAFTADLTIMEEASEFVRRFQEGRNLPMLTSCSPAWVKYVEQFYPEFIPNISTCKSPQAMLGSLVKSYYAEQEHLDPATIVSVAVMPCTAKKFEAKRPELSRNGYPDIDIVLTTRELSRLLHLFGIDLTREEPEPADSPFGKRSTAGKLFGASGGVMEAALRTAYFLITGEELTDLVIKPLRGLEGRKEAKITIGSTEIGTCVVSGLLQAGKLLDEIKAGRDDIHFIEVMSCPGGCIAGGGQPIGSDPEAIQSRMQRLYMIDKEETVRCAHHNTEVKELYDEYLGTPLGERSHALLHTTYKKREVVV